MDSGAKRGRVASELPQICSHSTTGSTSTEKGLQRAFLYVFQNVQTFLGDFNLQKLPLRRLEVLWEWKNRVLLEQYYISTVVIPLEVE